MINLSPVFFLLFFIFVCQMRNDAVQWFSESGKLVQRLFEHILELADDEDSLVCVLVDEVL